MIPPGLLRFERSSEKRVNCGERELFNLSFNHNLPIGYEPKGSLRIPISQGYLRVSFKAHQICKHKLLSTVEPWI